MKKQTMELIKNIMENDFISKKFKRELKNSDVPKSKNKARHGLRVMHICEHLAEPKKKLTDEEKEQLYVAAALHDICKYDNSVNDDTLAVITKDYPHSNITTKYVAEIEENGGLKEDLHPIIGAIYTYEILIKEFNKSQEYAGKVADIIMTHSAKNHNKDMKLTTCQKILMDADTIDKLNLTPMITTIQKISNKGEFVAFGKICKKVYEASQIKLHSKEAMILRERRKEKVMSFLEYAINCCYIPELMVIKEKHANRINMLFPDMVFNIAKEKNKDKKKHKVEKLAEVAVSEIDYKMEGDTTIMRSENMESNRIDEAKKELTMVQNAIDRCKERIEKDAFSPIDMRSVNSQNKYKTIPLDELKKIKKRLKSFIETAERHK